VCVSGVTRDYTTLQYKPYVRHVPCCFANIRQPEEKHHNALKPNASTTVRKSAVAERVNVGMDVFDWNIPSLGTLLEKLRVVDTLRTR